MAKKSTKERSKERSKTRSRARTAAENVASAVKSVPPVIVWMLLLAIALPTIAALLVKAVQYDEVIRKSKQIEKPLEKMRYQLAEVFETDLLKHDSELAVEELLKMDKHMETAYNMLEEEKTAYTKLFQGTAKSSHGWQLFGRSLYYTAKGKKSWYDAEYFCRSRGAHLTSIHSDEEQNFITSELQGPAWIGLTDKNEQNKWEWIDGSGLMKQYWSGSASNVSEHHREKEQYCVSVVPSVNQHNWNHANCHKQNGWICKDTLPVDEI